MMVRAVACLALLLLCPSCRRDEPANVPATSISNDAPAEEVLPPGARLEINGAEFGFVNASGAELLVSESLATPGTFRWAVCGDGRARHIEYVRWQPQRDSSWREVSADFPGLRGQVFRPTAGVLSADATCFITADSLFALTARPAIGPDSTECGPALVAAASGAKGRPVVSCSIVAGSGQQRWILVAQFATRDTSALASIILAGPGGMHYWDIESPRGDADEDVWRVGDGGQFSASAFGVLFVGRHRGIDYLALTWPASEGENDYLLVADSASTLRELRHHYRYWF